MWISLYSSTVEEIKTLLKVRQTYVTHVLKCQTNSSHFLANYARTQTCTSLWLSSGPKGLMSISHTDCNLKYLWVIQVVDLESRPSLLWNKFRQLPFVHVGHKTRGDSKKSSCEMILPSDGRGVYSTVDTKTKRKCSDLASHLYACFILLTKRP
jgi:hypothetical protein